jgi:hypothetical protein
MGVCACGVCAHGVWVCLELLLLPLFAVCVCHVGVWPLGAVGMQG